LYVRVLGEPATLANWLRDRSDIREVLVSEGLVSCTLDGGQEHQANLLREIIHAGFSIHEFSSKNKTLEDVFLHVTEGRVQ
jgi:ABC-2 type transport system ATP-binding protein